MGSLPEAKACGKSGRKSRKGIEQGGGLVGEAGLGVSVREKRNFASGMSSGRDVLTLKKEGGKERLKKILQEKERGEILSEGMRVFR